MGAPVEEGRGGPEVEFAIEGPKLEAEGRVVDAVDAVSPIDGRYRRTAEALAPYFSERALIGHRLTVEVEYWIALSEQEGVPCREFSNEEKAYLRSLPDVTPAEASVVKAIEVKGYTPPGGEEIPRTNHDVKAVEYYLREKVRGTSLEDSTHWIHFALTSEDVNNLSYALMIRGANQDVMRPALLELENRLWDLAEEHRDLPILSRTHGQPASPTTLGRQFLVFNERIGRLAEQLFALPIRGKLNGATGNFNAHYVALPDIDWEAFSADFVAGLGRDEESADLTPNLITTQIEDHESYVALFDAYARLNETIIDFNRDIWRYISDKWFLQRKREGEIGSSTMPHKVNPIDFENSEGRLDIANAQFAGFRRLLQSRLQRDLSDSTVQRSIGEAFANSLIAYRATLRGLDKLLVNEGAIRADLDAHPEVITEAIQTILRREGQEGAYELIMKASRGKQLTLEEIHDLAIDLDVPESVKAEIRAITPQNYIGNAGEMQPQTDDRLS